MAVRAGEEMYHSPNLFVPVEGVIDSPVQLKIEGLNIAGSVKLKSALQMVRDLEASGLIQDSSHLIESSSGNMGIALGMVCAERGYQFTCVTDPNVSASAVAKMRALGVEIVHVQEPDGTGNFLSTRINRIREMLRRDPTLLWLNQYANQSNWRAHYLSTGPEILDRFPQLDYLVVGAGTTGTLTGCARYIRENSPHTVIVAVDSVGSVTFDTPPAVRHIPGLGMSQRPEIADPTVIDKLLLVDEADAVRMCRELARRGLLMGGSTGSVLAGVRKIAHQIRGESVVVAVSPDLGDKYLDTVYSDVWVGKTFPELDSQERLSLTDRR